MTQTITTTLDGRHTTVAAGAGDAPAHVNGAAQCVVTAAPGAGGSMLAEATWSDPAAVAAGTATWFPWDAGTVSAKANQLLLNATAVRFTATAAAGVGEVAR